MHPKFFNRDDSRFDAIVIGAGAAGIAAALELKRAGLSFLVLEARDRIGGRAFDVGTGPYPLGAEFVHGIAKETRRRLERVGLAVVPGRMDFHVFDGNRLHPAPNYWKTLADAFSHLRAREHDRSFAEFVRQAPLTAAERKISAAFVEGFDAAELGRISANALAEGKSAITNPRERALARPERGYDDFLHALASPLGESVRLNAEVYRIDWNRGLVEVSAREEGRETFYAATAAIVTLPVGVLKAPAGAPGAIRFSPELPNLRRTLDRIEMGHVYRIVLEFDADAYALLTKRFAGGELPFTSSPDLEFTTWWGIPGLPAITAWAGGAHALKLAELSTVERVARALDGLARILGLEKVSTLEAALRQSYTHDWTRDPYARGAYSYPGLASSGAFARLARAVDHTLYFAGEATEEEFFGTVEGALRSGRRQARKVVAARGGPRTIDSPFTWSPPPLPPDTRPRH